MSVRRSLLGRETLQALLRWTIVPPRGIRPSVSRPDVRGFSLFLLASLLERLPRCRLLDPINKVGSASRFREPAKEGRSLFCQFQPKLLAVKDFGKKKWPGLVAHTKQDTLQLSSRYAFRAFWLLARAIFLESSFVLPCFFRPTILPA